MRKGRLATRSASPSFPKATALTTDVPGIEADQHCELSPGYPVAETRGKLPRHVETEKVIPRDNVTEELRLIRNHDASEKGLASAMGRSVTRSFEERRKSVPDTAYRPETTGRPACRHNSLRN